MYLQRLALLGAAVHLRLDADYLAQGLAHLIVKVAFEDAKPLSVRDHLGAGGKWTLAS